MQTVLTTHRPWHRRLMDAVVHRWRLRRDLAALRSLDRAALADVGIDASEIPSIVAEAGSSVARTRLRIVERGCHG
ncbi:MAG: hypothetical protein U1F56_21620 [Rubrivivax sp.]